MVLGDAGHFISCSYFDADGRICLSSGLGNYVVIPSRHPTGAAAKAGEQEGQSIEDELSADIDPEAAMEALRSWESMVESVRAYRMWAIITAAASLTRDFFWSSSSSYDLRGTSVCGPPRPRFVISELAGGLSGWYTTSGPVDSRVGVLVGGQKCRSRCN
jgi:hypothetical protein